MNYCHQTWRSMCRLTFVLVGAAGLLALTLWSAAVPLVSADPIPPQVGGYPKFNLSTKTVTPTLAATGGTTLTYVLTLQNTGAYTAEEALLVDRLPAGVTYNGDLTSTVPFSLSVMSETLSWRGTVGFDASAVISFSVSLAPEISGTVRNVAVISHPLALRPVTVTAETVVTDAPLFSIEKSSFPEKPGANQSLVYTLLVTNEGQPAQNVSLTVTDHLPLNTMLRDVGIDGETGPLSDVVTWTRQISLALGETTAFTFSVDVGDVPSGTVISNDEYAVASSVTGLTAGEPYTVAIVDPILSLTKDVWPDPPGSNREMTYTLTLFNAGSMATNLVVTDRVPSGVTYLRGGTESGGIVSWTLASLDTQDVAEFTYTVYVSDVFEISVVNSDYGVCSDQDVCSAGRALTSVVQGPHFETWALLDPIAHKPGGGQGTEVTPTLIVQNAGPGNALGAQAYLFFGRLSVNYGDLLVIPSKGTLIDGGPYCGSKCAAYTWQGDLDPGERVTFTTSSGQNTIGGEEGTPYTATVVITDALSNGVTEPVSATAMGLVTHYANVVPIKRAPRVIGAGQLLTYTISVYNRGMSTSEPPVLTDVVPLSTTFVAASHGGNAVTLSETTVVSWVLPLLSPGDGVVRTFTVLVDGDLVSGTQIVNREYAAFGYGNVMTDAVTSGPPVTTTVKDVGLIDSYKRVTPKLASPESDVVLTYTIHVVNSGPLSLTGVSLYDLLPWEHSTYLRTAVAGAGDVTSDVVSLRWSGDVGAFSEVVVTATVLVDEGYHGPLTNTATISHADLAQPVKVSAVAYVSDEPILFISKEASAASVESGDELRYTIWVSNLGQQATGLVVTDAIPANSTYLTASASGDGAYADGLVRWDLPVLKAGASRSFEFSVVPGEGSSISNDRYGVRSAEGVSAVGAPVVTQIAGGGGQIYLPLVLRNAP